MTKVYFSYVEAGPGYDEDSMDHYLVGDGFEINEANQVRIFTVVNTTELTGEWIQTDCFRIGPVLKELAGEWIQLDRWEATEDGHTGFYTAGDLTHHFTIDNTGFAFTEVVTNDDEDYPELVAYAEADVQ